MTIDEAIAREKEMAKQQNTKYDKCPTRIKYCCEMCFHNPKCNEVAEYHEQLAEWLEDYRRLLEFEKSVLANEDGYLATMCERIGYNKAIDDFKKMLTIEKIKEYAESDGFINLNNCSLMIFDIAEKLKVGGKNG